MDRRGCDQETRQRTTAGPRGEAHQERTDPDVHRPHVHGFCPRAVDSGREDLVDTRTSRLEHEPQPARRREGGAVERRLVAAEDPLPDHDVAHAPVPRLLARPRVGGDVLDRLAQVQARLELGVAVEAAARPRAEQRRDLSPGSLVSPGGAVLVVVEDPLPGLDVRREPVERRAVGGVTTALSLTPCAADATD